MIVQHVENWVRSHLPLVVNGVSYWSLINALKTNNNNNNCPLFCSSLIYGLYSMHTSTKMSPIVSVWSRLRLQLLCVES